MHHLPLPLIADDRDWIDRALCAQTDPEIFYPDKGGTTRPAKAVCARCEVRAECLQEALDTGDEHGIRGGLSPRERRNRAIPRTIQLLREHNLEPSTVRSWARRNGHHVNVAGPLRLTVIEAYLQAHSEEQTA